MSWGRVISGLIALGYLALGYSDGGPYELIQMVMFLLLPMACIWFGEELGSFTGVMRMQHIDRASPGCLVAFVGWLVLLSPVLYVLFVKVLWPRLLGPP